MSQIYLIVIISLFSTSAYGLGRSELSRYYLLRDRVLAQQERNTEGGHFLSIDLVISSGARGLISDIDNATSQGSQLDQTIAVNKLLLKNANTERFIDADASAGIPLPYIKIKEIRILPQLFFGFNLGASTSISSPTGDPADTILQAYVKKEIRLGLDTKIRFRAKETWNFKVTRLTRADLLETRDASTIAASGDTVDINSLNQNDSSWRLALGFDRDNKNSNWFIHVSDIKMAKAPGHQRNAIYDFAPLWHLGLARKLTTNWGKIKPFVGLHYRERYGIDDGFYIGLKTTLDHQSPISLETRADNAFFTIAPAFESRFFKFRYGFQTPYRNPQSDLWVSAMHVISMTFPFP